MAQLPKTALSILILVENQIGDTSPDRALHVQVEAACPERGLCAHWAGDSAGRNRESELNDPITFRIFHVKTFDCAARDTQISKQGFPFRSLGSFEKASLFRSAKEAGVHVPTTAGGRKSETTDEL
jgi:hypothetical protein